MPIKPQPSSCPKRPCIGLKEKPLRGMVSRLTPFIMQGADPGLSLVSRLAEPGQRSLCDGAAPELARQPIRGRQRMPNGRGSAGCSFDVRRLTACSDGRGVSGQGRGLAHGPVRGVEVLPAVVLRIRRTIRSSCFIQAGCIPHDTSQRDILAGKTPASAQWRLRTAHGLHESEHRRTSALAPSVVGRCREWCASAGALPQRRTLMRLGFRSMPPYFAASCSSCSLSTSMPAGGRCAAASDAVVGISRSKSVGWAR